MAKAPQSEKLNPLALSGVQLANVISRSPVRDSTGRKVTVTPSALTHWVAAGCPRNPDKTYNAIFVLAWLAGERALVPYKASAESNEEKKENVALKRERRLAVRQARLERQGQLIEREVIEEDQQRRIHAVKGGLLTLERSLAREIVGLPRPQAEAIIKGKVRDLLEGYASGWNGEGEILSLRKGPDDGTDTARRDSGAENAHGDVHHRGDSAVHSTQVVGEGARGNEGETGGG